MACCVRGYHVYKDIRAAAVGEVLACRREPSNASDRYAIAVLKHGMLYTLYSNGEYGHQIQRDVDLSD